MAQATTDAAARAGPARHRASPRRYPAYCPGKPRSDGGWQEVLAARSILSGLEERAWLDLDGNA